MGIVGVLGGTVEGCSESGGLERTPGGRDLAVGRKSRGGGGRGDPEREQKDQDLGEINAEEVRERSEPEVSGSHSSMQDS